MTYHRIYSTDHSEHLHSDSKQHVLLLVSGPSSYLSRNDDFIFGVSKKMPFHYGTNEKISKSGSGIGDTRY